MSQLEKSINDILTLPIIEAAVTAANSAANAANSAANAAKAIAALTNSGVLDATLTATDAGSSASIAVTSHTRVYGDNTSVSVSAGVITGLTYSTTYYVYYDQASRLGGPVSYQATTSKTVAVQTGDRHLVGSITTPASAGAAITGKYVEPSGLGSIS